MAIKNENKLSAMDLENVTGGTIMETFGDSLQLYKRGLLDKEFESSATVRARLHDMGYSGYTDKSGMMNSNVYSDKNGNTITREQFWANFDHENGTKIIR